MKSLRGDRLDLSRHLGRGLVVLILAGSLALVAAGCGSTSESTGGSNAGVSGTSGQPPNKRAKVRAERAAARQRARNAARRAGAESRRKARQARTRARLAARKARAADRRFRLKARALARRGGDVDCGAFASQARAQLYLLPGDPFGLDGDGDGVACADLPCPCSSAAGEGSSSADSSSGEEGNGPDPPRRFRGTVVDVADGDTLDVTTPSGSTETVRIIGIDTPEVYYGVECGGPAASAAMKRIATGAEVTVTADPTQDRRDHYGRLLAYIDKGSHDLGYTMVKRGLASAYPYDGPFQRYPKYARADQRARQNKIGSWARCDISPG